MSHLAALLLSFFGLALLHAAAPERFPFPLRARASAAWGPLLRAGCVASLVAAGLLFRRHEGAPAAWLLTIAAATVSGAVVVLAAPVFPRALWVAAGLAAPAAILLLLA